MFRDDYLLRMIQQLAEAVARIAGLNERAEYDRALAAADQAWSDLLEGPALPAALDSHALAAVLQTPARIRLAHQIVRQQARALAGKGDAIAAAERSRRALELLLEARARDPRDGDDAVLCELARAVPREAVAPRYRAMLAGSAGLAGGTSGRK